MSPQSQSQCLSQTSPRSARLCCSPLKTLPSRNRPGRQTDSVSASPAERGRHTAVDHAHALKDLSDTHFPSAAKIVLVQDNLSTHKPASLYEAAAVGPVQSSRDLWRFVYDDRDGFSRCASEPRSLPDRLLRSGFVARMTCQRRDDNLGIPTAEHVFRTAILISTNCSLRALYATENCEAFASFSVQRASYCALASSRDLGGRAHLANTSS